MLLQNSFSIITAISSNTRESDFIQLFDLNGLCDSTLVYSMNQ